MTISVRDDELAALEKKLEHPVGLRGQRQKNQVVIKMDVRDGELMYGHYATFDSDRLILLTVKYNVKGALVFY